MEVEGPGPLTKAALKHGVEKVQFNTTIFFYIFCQYDVCTFVISYLLLALDKTR